jgi:hypothetical protein
MSTVQSLKDSGLKATLPRRKILELFETTKVRHLSAEDVYKALIAEGIDVGLATVYRSCACNVAGSKSSTTPKSSGGKTTSQGLAASSFTDTPSLFTPIA